MLIGRRQLAIDVLSAFSACALAGCDTPRAEAPRGDDMLFEINLGMRTTADTERAVTPLTPVFAGDGLAFSVKSSAGLYLGLVDHLEHKPHVVGESARITPGTPLRLPSKPGAWIELSQRAPLALCAVIATRTQASESELLALAATDREGWDALPVAFDPAYAVDALSARPPTQGLPRRRFVLRGRRLARTASGYVRVTVPGDHRAAIAVLAVEHR